MEFFIVGMAALFVSGLTLFSGFGLGTLLLPVFALFFPVEIAVAATAIVHAANSLFKFLVVGKHADRKLIVHFGLPAVVAAIAGAAALGYVAHFGEIGRYDLGSRIAIVTPVKVVVATLMLGFALFELLPRFQRLKFREDHLFIGGVLSGFFGGFSGHQGALRSVFLSKIGISTEAFVGTNAGIALMVDVARVAVYAATFLFTDERIPFGSDAWPLIVTGVVAAFAGVMMAKRFLHAVTMKSVQALTGALLVVIALSLGAGII